MPPHLTLIISVYNKPDVLRLVLAACDRQTYRDFEIIIADDGSGPGVAEVVREASAYEFPVRHLRHEDKGWRKNIILNTSIRESKGKQLVFIDGDCIPSGTFLEDHYREAEDGRVLLGRRAEMSQRWSESLSPDKVRSGEFEKLGWREFVESLEGKLKRFEDGVRITNASLRSLLLRNVDGMLGSNFSCAKSGLEAINGFDEEYRGPGCGEDSDIHYRLSLLGVMGKSLRNLAIQFHVWHPRTKPSAESFARFNEIVKRSSTPRCQRGLVGSRDVHLPHRSGQ